jgi:Zn-dependent peptidase ImmA (M78 family)
MSTLQSLRQLTPVRPLTDSEARFVAERQAILLRSLSGMAAEPLFPRSVVESQPKLVVVTDSDLPQSGSSHWTGSSWQITLNGSEPFTRQRFTLLHEYKHIIDHPHADVMFAGSSSEAAAGRAETLCDLFAACVLMPKMLVRQAWVAGGDNQNPAELARLFGVSEPAMRLRLLHLGLHGRAQRCRGSGARRYFRQAQLHRVPARSVGRRDGMVEEARMRATVGGV